MRSLCLLAFGCLVGLLVYTFDLKIKTRALEVQAHELLVALQDEGDFLALMRAEVSYLSRPERIEDMARKTLRLEPLATAQLVPWSALTSGGGSEWRTEVTQSRREGIAALIERTSAQGSAQRAR
jgi:cell division protein FtsL